MSYDDSRAILMTYDAALLTDWLTQMIILTTHFL